MRVILGGWVSTVGENGWVSMGESCMGGWESIWVGGWVSEWVYVWASECGWMGGQVNE